MTVCCWFYIRHDGADPERLYVAGFEGGSNWLTDHPPVVGDLIRLFGTVSVGEDEPERKVGGVWRVVEREWMPASYGSVNWPYGQPQQVAPLMLAVSIEPAVPPEPGQ